MGSVCAFWPPPGHKNYVFGIMEFRAGFLPLQGELLWHAHISVAWFNASCFVRMFSKFNAPTREFIPLRVPVSLCKCVQSAMGC